MPRKVRKAIDAAARRRGRRATLSVGRQELCDFVAEVCSAFNQLAKRYELRFLCYLLEMVVEEAVHQSRIEATLPPASTDS